MTSLNGVALTYHLNGNLTFDGVNSYTYDGTTTTYRHDLTVGLAQLLTETTGANTTRYLHGHNLIAQHDNARQFYGYDGLGSLRQTWDNGGTFLNNQDYDPYGVPFQTSTLSLGYTGELTDPNGLVYLRARVSETVLSSH
ncbi:MAG: hypothetical protein OHK0023_03360 [Anaerolineae bacterium]